MKQTYHIRYLVEFKGKRTEFETHSELTLVERDIEQVFKSILTAIHEVLGGGEKGKMKIKIAQLDCDGLTKKELAEKVGLLKLRDTKIYFKK